MNENPLRLLLRKKDCLRVIETVNALEAIIIREFSEDNQDFDALGVSGFCRYAWKAMKSSEKSAAVIYAKQDSRKNLGRTVIYLSLLQSIHIFRMKFRHMSSLILDVRHSLTGRFGRRFCFAGVSTRRTHPTLQFAPCLTKFHLKIYWIFCNRVKYNTDREPQCAYGGTVE